MVSCTALPTSSSLVLMSEATNCMNRVRAFANHQSFVPSPIRLSVPAVSPRYRESPSASVCMKLVLSVLIEVVGRGQFFPDALIIRERVGLTLLTEDVELKLGTPLQPTFKCLREMRLGHV